MLRPLPCWLLLLTAAPLFGQTLLYSDSLNQSTKGRRFGGEFVPGGGWRAVQPSDRLILELPRVAGDGSVFEMDIRNLNAPAQVDAPENHILGLWEHLYYSGGDASLPGMDCFVLYAGKKYPQFKLKYHTTGFARQEATYAPITTFDPDHTYKLRAEWRGGKFTVSLDGNAFYVQDTPALDAMDNVRYIHIGANWRSDSDPGTHVALQGPVYSNIRVHVTEADAGAPRNLRLIEKTPSSATLTWEPPANGSADTYHVYRSGQFAGSTSNPARFLDTRLADGVYSYTVRALAGGAGASPAESSPLRVAISDSLAIARSGTVKVDGDLAEKEWNIDRRVLKPLKGSSSAQVSFGSLHDTRNLYLALRIGGVADPDSARVELLFDSDNNGQPGLYANRKFDGHDLQVMLKLADSAISVRTSNGKDVPGAAARVLRSGSGYTAEIAIPWTLLGGTPRLIESAGFDLRFHDAAGLLGWSSEHLDPLITSAYGELKVMRTE